MKLDEANKIIANFMNVRLARNDTDVQLGYGLPVDNYNSLDALVPVWEKMQIDFDFMLKGSFVKNNFRIHNSYSAHQDTETIQEAAYVGRISWNSKIL